MAPLLSFSANVLERHSNSSLGDCSYLLCMKAERSLLTFSFAVSFLFLFFNIILFLRLSMYLNCTDVNISMRTNTLIEQINKTTKSCATAKRNLFFNDQNLSNTCVSGRMQRLLASSRNAHVLCLNGIQASAFECLQEMGNGHLPVFEITAVSLT